MQQTILSTQIRPLVHVRTTAETTKFKYVLCFVRFLLFCWIPYWRHWVMFLQCMGWLAMLIHISDFGWHGTCGAQRETLCNFAILNNYLWQRLPHLAFSCFFCFVLFYSFWWLALGFRMLAPIFIVSWWLWCNTCLWCEMGNALYFLLN